MIAITDLAKQIPCNHKTIVNWAKRNKLSLKKSKALSGKVAQSLSKENSDKFIEYWRKSTTLPEGMITIPDVAKKYKVDRKTIRLWVDKNNIYTRELRRASGPPTKIMNVKDVETFGESYNTPNCVPVSKILQEYNTDWRVIKRWAKKNECKFYETKSEKGGRNNYSVKKEDYTKLSKYLIEIKDDGFFYMIQLIPEIDPNRIKLGFSKCLSNRILQHKCTCPNAKIIKKWKCKKDNEVPVINEVSKNNCNRLYTDINNKKTITEVFDCEDYRLIKDKLDELLGED